MTETSPLAVRVYALSRGIIGFVWIYHGLVPKILFPTGDRALTIWSGVSPERAANVTTAVGALEITLGILILALWRERRLLIIQSIALLALPCGLVLYKPMVFVEPFNPVTLTLCMIGLATVAWWAWSDLPAVPNKP